MQRRFLHDQWLQVQIRNRSLFSETKQRSASPSKLYFRGLKYEFDLKRRFPVKKSGKKFPGRKFPAKKFGQKIPVKNFRSKISDQKFPVKNFRKKVQSKIFGQKFPVRKSGQKFPVKKVRSQTVSCNASSWPETFYTSHFLGYDLLRLLHIIHFVEVEFLQNIRK
jgi:hypothetical protein